MVQKLIQGIGWSRTPLPSPSLLLSLSHFHSPLASTTLLKVANHSCKCMGIITCIHICKLHAGGVHFFDAEKMPGKLCMSNLRVFVNAVVHFALWTSLFTCCTRWLCHLHWNDKQLSSWLCELRGGAIALAYAHFSVHVPHLKKNMPVPITSLPINTIYSMTCTPRGGNNAQLHRMAFTFLKQWFRQWFRQFLCLHLVEQQKS